MGNPAKCAACGGNHKAYDQKCLERKIEMDRIAAACLTTVDRHPIIPSSTPPPDIPYFPARTILPLSSNSKNTAKKHHPKPMQNPSTPITPDARLGVSTRSQASSKRYLSEMNSPEISQREQSKRHPTISKDARLPLAEKSNNIQSKSVAETLDPKSPLPNANTPAKSLAQEISDQLLRENNNHINNKLTAELDNQ